jgi:hypothetical protein
MENASSQKKVLSAKCVVAKMELHVIVQGNFLRRRSSVRQEGQLDSAMCQAVILSAHVRHQRLSSKMLVMLLSFLKRRLSQILTPV